MQCKIDIPFERGLISGGFAATKQAAVTIASLAMTESGKMVTLDSYLSASLFNG